MRLPSHDPKSHPEVLDLGGGRTIELRGILGRGQGTVVYDGVLTAPHGLSRRVAVKTFPTPGSDDAESVVEALGRAVRRAACVDHPNVVQTFELGFHFAQPFIVMERVEGITLRALLDRVAANGRRLPLDVALHVAVEIGAALDGARTARDMRGVQLNLCHHALNACDVLLSWRGEVKVTDFGHSWARAASSSVRSLRSVVNRADSMSPEVARGGVGDAQSDVFSLGLVLRELVVGPRFPKGTPHDQVLRLARDGFIHESCLAPRLPEGVSNILHRALQLEPEDRYTTVSGMAWDLRRVALTMGAAESRESLRRTMARELGVDSCEITKETVAPDQDAEPVDEADVIDISPAARRRR